MTALVAGWASRVAAWRKTPFVLLVAVGSLLGIFAALAKAAVDAGWHPLAFLFWSLAGSGAILFVLATRNGQRPPLSPPHAPLFPRLRPALRHGAERALLRRHRPCRRRLRRPRLRLSAAHLLSSGAGAEDGALRRRARRRPGARLPRRRGAGGEPRSPSAMPVSAGSRSRLPRRSSSPAATSSAASTGRPAPRRCRWRRAC